MNNSDNRGNRGASITPSARPSIHNHCDYCPFAASEEIMVRYGVSDSNAEEPGTSHASEDMLGEDEVDNILSKNALAYVPTPTRKKHPQKRNSLSFLNDVSSTESDESHMLSKSLPTYIPSSSYSSDYDGVPTVIRQNELHKNYLDIASSLRQRNMEQNNAARNTNRKQYQQPTVESSDNDMPDRTLNTEQHDTKLLHYLWPLLIAGFISLVLKACHDYNTKFRTGPRSALQYNKVNFYNDLYTLGDKYKVDSDAVLQLQMGISSIFEKQDTGSFMFVFNSNNENFNLTMFNDFINEVAVNSAKYLRNESATARPISLDSSKLVVHDSSVLIDMYREDVSKGGVMLLKKIDMLPSNLAMALHYYCDEYNPLVKKSAMLFTLNLASCPQVSGQRLNHALIEKCLMSKWHLIPVDNIGPLLTRVINVVVDVTKTFNF